ncbi:piwi-like protein Siwi [Melanaphis sacchari]|uniref:piwi-like protein Siwi n=1 Tax=Melanaphis sacchari TaxID=742174 RepID=UPI000DC14CFF|nr:piwi-like protein Siwi [Melanaphis sacchari]
MEQIRPQLKGRARGNSQEVRVPRPTQSTQSTEQRLDVVRPFSPSFLSQAAGASQQIKPWVQRPRPTSSLPTQTTRSFPTPWLDAAQRPPSAMPSQAVGTPWQKGSRPHTGVAPRQHPMSGVQQVTEGLKNLGAGQGAVHKYKTTSKPESLIRVDGKQGTTGQDVKLLTNYFPITSYKNYCLYQYEVVFNLEEDTINIKRNLLAQHRERLGGYLFDGTMLFSVNRYDPPTFELTSIRRSNEQKVIIKVKFTNIIETGDHANIKVFNLLLHNCFRYLDLSLIGRNFYDSKAKVDLPQYKLQIWPGFDTTIGRYENNILLCADLATKIIREETVFHFFNECFADKNHNWLMNFKNGVIGTTVMTKYNNKTYRIDDVDENLNPSSKFDKKDGSKMTYIQYYKEKWNVTIRGGWQPMLISKNKSSIFEVEDTLVYLVPELCLMTGLTDKMRNNFHLMKEIAPYTLVDPEVRKEKLTNFVNLLLNTPDSVTELKKWNMTVSNKFVELNGRKLPPEPILSHTSSYFGGYEADWSNIVWKLPMFKTAIVSHWTIVTPEVYVNEVGLFAQSLTQAAQKMSFALPKPSIVTINDVKANTYLTKLEEVINTSNPALILCVILSSRGDVYTLIKRMLCIDRAVPSQIVLLRNVQKNNLSLSTKIAIQINCKLGGTPWLVNIPRKGLMIIGFDVYHDSHHSSVSFGALVATMNDTHTNYFSCVEPHESGEELSVYFATAILKALTKYKNKNGKLPSSIIVYRAGVGEGQISNVYKTEVELLQTACEKMYGTPTVPFTFVVVTKRISTRFFAPNSGTIKNPQPGTVVDTVVTDPTKYDFFLVSQYVRQGTVNPTHYNVIEDTLRFPPDILQRLTFKLTHMYYNWPGTIRVPAPCQYAHKLALLTGKTLRSAANSALDETLFFL